MCLYVYTCVCVFVCVVCVCVCVAFEASAWRLQYTIPLLFYQRPCSPDRITLAANTLLLQPVEEVQ